MNQQHLYEQTPYSIERASTKGPMHLRHARKLSQLQSKANFFQGQINPIYNENLSLKEQLMQLSKMVSCSTDILRNLLPDPDDPNKKLKLQLADLQEIACMIRIDWKDMEKKLHQNNLSIKQLQCDKQSWHNKYQIQYNRRLSEIDQLNSQQKQIKADYQEKIQLLKKKIVQINYQNCRQKQRMNQQFVQKLASYDLKLRQFQIYRRQVQDKYQQYQKCVLRLRGEIQANLLAFEQNKKHLKVIYDKLTAEKLAEQAQGYEMMLKIKEQQRDSLVRQMIEAQQQNKRTLADKQTQITKLNSQNYLYKEQIGNLKDDIWKKQMQIDQQHSQNQKILKQVQKLSQKNRVYAKTIQQKQKEFQLQKTRLQENLFSKSKEIQLIKEQSSVAIKKILEDKQLLEESLQQKQKKLKQVLLSVKKNQEEWDSRVNLMKTEWNNQKTKLQTQIDQNIKKLQIQSQKLKVSLLQKQQIRKQSQKHIKSLERQYNKQKEYQNKLWNSKLLDIQQKNKEELVRLQCQHQRMISDVKTNANEQMRQMLIENNKKLTQQQSRFMQQILRIQTQGQQIQKKLKKAEVTLRAKEEQMQKAKIEQNIKIKLLQRLREQQKQEINQQMQNQMKQFQKSMETKEAQFQRSMLQKQAQLKLIKSQMQNEIKMLKQANAIQSIQNKYLSQISKLKQQFEQKFQQKQSQNKKQKQLLQQNNKKNIQILTKSYKKQIEQLLRNNQNKLNQLFACFSYPEQQHMSSQQKKQYILNSINQMKGHLHDKDCKIGELQSQLELIRQDIQKEIKIRRQQLQKQKHLFQQNCNKKIDDMNSQCKARIIVAQKQKLTYTQNLYQQFENMRKNFQNDYGILQKRYNELQKLFEERPSRAQDLTKIKELTNMQNKMDIQIQTYHKKMETANQIVKYLNLQLSNYKDAYDIFGHNQDGNSGVVGHSPIKSPHKSKQSVHAIQILKSQKHDTESRNFDQIRVRKQSLQIKRWNDSPTINELKVFEQNECDSSLVLEVNQGSQQKQGGSSNLISQKNIKKQRFKTQKIEKVDNESEIIINAQNFIRLIKGSKKEQLTGIQEAENEAGNRRKNYRKRVIKRYPTIGIDHYF